MTLKNVLYRSVVVSALEIEHGEEPTEIVLTEEVNCYVTWRCDEEGNHPIHLVQFDRNAAIEMAVKTANSLRAEVAK